ncbi:MAG: universal stress protein [Candidatus Binatia bacterium]
MPLKRILWASDGSKESLEALKWAEVFATRYGAKITALNVIESPNTRTLEVPDDLQREISIIDSEMGKREARRLARVGNVLRKKGIKLETQVVKGVPPQEIVNAAQSHAVDLIAMGKRGLTPWGRMLLGSTTASVLREAHVPIMAVRRTARRRAVKKLLLPTSFFPKDTVSLEWGLELARKFGAALFVLRVIEAHKSYSEVKGGFVGRLRQSANRQLRAMLDSVPSRKLKGVSLVEQVTIFPRAWSGIVNFAQDQGIDVIVMSTHARKGVPRFFLGSVAEAVIEEAPCPVIAVPPSFHSPAQSLA